MAEAQLDHYVAIFIPGGHGAMWDLPHSAPLATLLGKAHDQGVPIATVCHGAAALLSARDQYGVSIVKGKRVNGFTNEEEAAIGLSALVPFLLETRLAELGGKFESAGLFQPHVVRDGQLITGQNPASSALVAEELMACLEPVTCYPPSVFFRHKKKADPARDRPKTLRDAKRGITALAMPALRPASSPRCA